MKALKCECCNAPLSATSMTGIFECKYCGVLYEHNEVSATFPNSDSIMTPNEMRACLGLTKSRLTEELYNSALVTLRDYNSTYYPAY